MVNGHFPYILCGKQVEGELTSICVLYIYRIDMCPGLSIREICGAQGPLEQELFLDFLRDILDQFNSIILFIWPGAI